MDAQRNEDCRHPGTTMTCPLCNLSMISCVDCFRVHCDSHTFMRTVDSQGRSIQVPIPTCNFDNNRASRFTADLLYVCGEHCEGREVFPLEQAAVFTRFPDQGLDILRRARKVDQVCEILRSIPSTLEQALTASIENDFQSAIDALSKSKEKATKDLQSELAKLRSELDNIIEALEKQKLEETIQTSGTRLEEIILALSVPEIHEKIESEQWLLYSSSRESLRSFERFYCIRRSGTLLDQSPAACEWKDRFYCLPGSKFKLLEIPSGEIYDCEVDLPYKEGEVWTALPDGSFFFCGSDMTTDCRQLNSQYTEITKIGRLQTLRSFPGIIHFDGSVYVFGGVDSNIPLKSIEAFNLRTRSSVTLPVQMCAPRYCFCPCVWNRQIFYGPGRGSAVIEVFDPVGILCQIAIRAAGSTGSTLVAVSEEEIVVLALDVIRYFPNKMLLEALTDECVRVLGC